MTFEKIFTGVSLLIGATQCVEGAVLLRVPLSNPFSIAFSPLEFFWLPISLLAMAIFAYRNRPLLVPASFSIYYLSMSTVLGMLSTLEPSAVHAYQTHGIAPIWGALCQLTFGAGFAVLSGLRLRRLMRESGGSGFATPEAVGLPDSNFS